MKWFSKLFFSDKVKGAAGQKAAAISIAAEQQVPAVKPQQAEISQSASAERTPAPLESGSFPTAEYSPEQRDIINASLLFNADWYRQTYGLGEYLDAAGHYLTIGWHLGWNPSTLFPAQEYLTEYPEAVVSGMNPLLYFETQGYTAGHWHDRMDALREEILAQNPDCREHLQDGFLRVRITNACNAKCRFCGVRLTFGPEKDHAMEASWYYKYCRPLYEKVRVLLITGGDAFVARESYPYMKFLSEQYPQVNVMTESNGIAFDERFRELAADNLFKTHFSINASNAAMFQQGCWEGPGGEAVYERFMTNIQAYLGLLKEKDRLCFAPSLSLVINHDTVTDVLDFVRLSLRMHAWYMGFFFDYTENDMNRDTFGQPELSRPVMRTLMELERVLGNKVFLYFRLWLPLGEAEPMQREVEAVSLAELQERYADILELAEGRSMQAEFEQRNALRRAAGKKELRMEEDYMPSLHGTVRGGTERCSSPWEALDLSPNGNIGVCCWSASILNFHSFISEDQESVDWERILNSFEYMSVRKRILQDNFRGCQTCCPLNGTMHPIESIFRYGFQRQEEKA